jgi:hypothetical protein
MPCSSIAQEQNTIITGAQNTELYIPILQSKKNIVLVANQTSVIINSNNK